MINGKKMDKNTVSIIKSILIEMVEDGEMYCGGIPDETQMIEKYGLTQIQCGRVETKVMEAIRMLSNYLQ